MHRHYGWHGIHVLPDDLIAFAWSAPMRDLAVKIGLSDVGLRKLLVSYGMTIPPQGHWNRVRAGRTVPAPPKSPPRRAGESGRIRVDPRFAPFVAKARPMSSSGPFATRAVPEGLKELRAQELKAIGRVTVPRTLDSPHPGLRGIIETEKRRRQKSIDQSWHWDSPRFDNPLDQRKLRLFNGIFLALAKRGHGGDASEREHEIHSRAIIGNTYLGLTIDIAGKHRTVTARGQRRPEPDLPANTPLILRIRPGFDNEIGEAWQDDEDGKLEAKVAEIASALIVAGEAKFRQELRKDEERAERERIEREAKAERERVEQEQRRIAKLHQLNQQRITDLQRSGELLRLSRDIRALVVQVRGAMAGRSDLDEATVEAWERWALEEADKLDPVLSGQILTHLRPPTLEQG